MDNEKKLCAIEKVEYLCEIAYICWYYNYKWMYDAWKTYDEMLLFYETILSEAYRDVNSSLLESIYIIVADEKKMKNMFDAFILS